MFLDGESQGELPARLSMSNAIWNDPVLRVEAIGYKAIERTLLREIKIINGLTGLLWVAEPVVEFWSLSVPIL